MADKKEKTLSYRRAEWFQSTSGRTLESYLKEAHTKLPNIADRAIAHDDQVSKSVKPADHPAGGLLLHLTVETPGGGASLVPHGTPTTHELDLAVVDPPVGGEWLDGDAYLYVNGDHVCLCTTGIRDGAVVGYFYALFQKAHLSGQSIQFLLAKVANISKLKMLHAQGVEELEIRGTLYKVTADYHKRKGHFPGALGHLGKFAKHLLGKPHDVNQDGLRVYIGLYADRRSKKHLSIGYKTLETLAADVVKHGIKDDDYVIVTKSGQRISPDEIFMKSTVLIEKEGKTVQRDKAWKELTNFYDELKNSGVLEQ